MRNSLGVWPYPAVSEAYRAGQDEWTEIDEEQMYYFLEVLPPRYFTGGFFVGEPAAHDSRGVPVHAAVVKARGRYFMRECPIDTPSIAKALRELMAALDAQRDATV